MFFKPKSDCNVSINELTISKASPRQTSQTPLHWQDLIGISLASTCVLSILFNKMDADFLDSLLGILMMPLGIGTTAFFISLIENENFD